MHHVSSKNAAAGDDLRDLPPRERISALREQIMRRFGPKVVGFATRQAPRKPQPHAGRGRIAAHTTFLALAALTVLSFCLPGPAHAGTLDLDLNLASMHTERWARDSLNQVNPGAGLTYHFNRTWSLMGGEYLNSYRCPTWYTLGAFTPLHIGETHRWHLDAGLVGGLATGYTRRENVYAPVVAGVIVRIALPAGIGLNLLAVPNDGPRDSGFIGFQLSIRLNRTGGDH